MLRARQIIANVTRVSARNSYADLKSLHFAIGEIPDWNDRAETQSIQLASFGETGNNPFHFKFFPEWPILVAIQQDDTFC
jgi:hypothetical protein